METPPAKGALILRRLIAYSEKVFRFSTEVLASLSDRRPEPRIATLTVAKAAMVLFWARMGSLNALEMSGESRFWKRWLGHPMPSAETMGDVHSKMDAAALREAIHQVYGCLKRNKALPTITAFPWPLWMATKAMPAIFAIVPDV